MSTGIEWTDETWNPVTGCTKVSQGCKNCYAERVFPRTYSGQRVETKTTNGRLLESRSRRFTDVWTHPDRLDAPLRWCKPRRIFVNSMSDLFHEDVPDSFILQVFDVMRQCANGWTGRLGGERGKLTAGHTFQILTKRSARMLDFCTRLRFAQNDGRGLYLADSLPHNGFNPMKAMLKVWLGVSVEDQATADERIPLLLQTPAAVRFVSYEPALGPLNLQSIDTGDAMYYPLEPWIDVEGRGRAPCPRLNWIIAGGESGPNARPAHPDWFRSVRDQCASASVAFFFKQWGEWAPAGTLEEEKRKWISSKRSLFFPGIDYCFTRLGKKAAGRLLDGREHSEYPA